MQHDSDRGSMSINPNGVQFTGSGGSCEVVTAFLGGSSRGDTHQWKTCTNDGGWVNTPEGRVEFNPGDWITRDGKGDLHVAAAGFFGAAASTRMPRDTPVAVNPAGPAHHAIDLDGLTAGDYVTIGGHWYGLTSAETQGTANFGPHHNPPEGSTGPDRGQASRNASYLKLKLMHCPWLGCPAEDGPR